MSTDNLIGSVADAIASTDPAAAMRFTRDINASGTPEDQIKTMNRYWRGQLSALPQSTISERTCLIDDIRPADWMRHFRQRVLPVILAHSLPKG